MIDPRLAETAVHAVADGVVTIATALRRPEHIAEDAWRLHLARIEAHAVGVLARPGLKPGRRAMMESLVRRVREALA